MSGFRFCPRCAQPLGERAEGGVPRRSCAAPGCGFVHWDNPVPVVAAIVEHEGLVVLARNALWPVGMFGLITGFLERGDPSPESGVLREVEEELGLAGELGGFIGHYPFERQNQLIIAFHVRASGPIRLSEELVEYKRVRPETIRPYAAATGLAMRDWLTRRGFSPPSEEDIVTGVRGFRRVDARLATAGQPDADEVLTLRASFDAVVNLVPDGHPQAYAGEAALVRLIGLRYHHLPLPGGPVRAADAERFAAIMEAEVGARVFVHCTQGEDAARLVSHRRASAPPST